MLFGQRLVESGIVTVENVQMALQLQVVHGGRLGTNLLKKGFIDIDTLSGALARHLGAPAAKLKHFEQVDRDALAMVPGPIAAKRKAFPLALATRNGRELLVAFRDPHDIQAVDEIAFASGARIRAFVAPELCILRYLERSYGIRLELEFPLLKQTAPNRSKSQGPTTQDLIVTPPAQARPTSSAPNRMLPHPSSWISMLDPAAPLSAPILPRASSRNIIEVSAPPLAPAVDFVNWGTNEPAPWDAPILDAADLEPVEPNAPLPEEVEVKAADLPKEVASGPWEESDERTPPIEALKNAAAWLPSLPSLPSLPPPAQQQAPSEAPTEKPKPERPALSIDAAIARIETAEDKDAIGDAISDHLRSSYGIGVVFIVKDEIAFGWRGFGKSLDASAVAAIAVPLNANSVLSLAYRRGALFRGAPDEGQSILQSHFFKLLKTDAPAEVIVAPISVKSRVVNLIYAQALDNQVLPEPSPAELSRLCRAAAEAFVRLIKRSKSSAGSAYS